MPSFESSAFKIKKELKNCDERYKDIFWEVIRLDAIVYEIEKIAMEYKPSLSKKDKKKLLDNLEKKIIKLGAYVFKFLENL